MVSRKIAEEVNLIPFFARASHVVKIDELGDTRIFLAGSAASKCAINRSRSTAAGSSPISTVVILSQPGGQKRRHVAKAAETDYRK
jgi:hypothetical protein